MPQEKHFQAGRDFIRLFAVVLRSKLIGAPVRGKMGLSSKSIAKERIIGLYLKSNTPLYELCMRLEMLCGICSCVKVYDATFALLFYRRA